MFVVKKTKREIVGMIQAWAALESMAAPLACANAPDEDLACLRRSFPEFFEGRPSDHLDEYSEANIRFHQKIIKLGGCPVIEDLCSNLLVHVRGIRNTALRQGDRASESIREHVRIIEARRPATPTSPSAWSASTAWVSPPMSSATATTWIEGRRTERMTAPVRRREERPAPRAHGDGCLRERPAERAAKAVAAAVGVRGREASGPSLDRGGSCGS